MLKVHSLIWQLSCTIQGMSPCCQEPAVYWTDTAELCAAAVQNLQPHLVTAVVYVHKGLHLWARSFTTLSQTFLRSWTAPS